MTRMWRVVGVVGVLVLTSVSAPLAQPYAAGPTDAVMRGRIFDSGSSRTAPFVLDDRWLVSGAASS